MGDNQGGIEGYNACVGQNNIGSQLAKKDYFANGVNFVVTLFLNGVKEQAGKDTQKLNGYITIQTHLMQLRRVIK